MAHAGSVVLARLAACPRPPHELVAYLFHRILGRGVPEIVSDLSDTPLQFLVEQVAGGSNPGPSSSQPGIPFGSDPLRDTLALPFRKAVLNRQAQHAYGGPRRIPVGETRLKDYYGRNPALSIASWTQEVEEAFAVGPLLELARDGDVVAAEALFSRYAHEVRQAIRNLTRSEEDAWKIELGVRARIIAEISEFEPRVQSVREFAKGSVFHAVQAHYGRREESSRRAVPPATFDGETQEVALDRLLQGALRRGRSLLSSPPGGPDAGLLRALEAERDVTLLRLNLSGVNPPHHATVVLIGWVFRRTKDVARAGTAQVEGGAKTHAESNARETGQYWEARQIVQRISHVPLRKLAHFFMGKYLKQSPYPEAILRPCFAPYMKQMDAPVATLLKHKKTVKTYSGPLDALAGDTQLRFYFTDDPEDNIAKWRFSAKRRTMKLIFRLHLGHLFEE